MSRDQKIYIRRQLFVDKDVQGVLLARVVLYWAFCLITVVLLLLCWRILVGPSRDLHVHLDYLWLHYRPILIAAVVLLPVLLLDTLRLSNRFAGPMVRLKRGLSQLADGRTDIAPLHFRRGDYWHEFAGEFNRIVQRIQEYESSAAESPSEARDQESQHHVDLLQYEPSQPLPPMQDLCQAAGHGETPEANVPVRSR